MEEFPVQLGRVYVAGLSAGGAAAAVMGSVYPDLYAAVGEFTPAWPAGPPADMFSAFSACGRAENRRAAASALHCRTIVFHGDRDTTVQSRQRRTRHCSVEGGVDPPNERQPRPRAGGIAYTATVQSDEGGIRC